MHCFQKKIFKRSCHNFTLSLLKLYSRGLQQVTSVQMVHLPTYHVTLIAMEFVYLQLLFNVSVISLPDFFVVFNYFFGRASLESTFSLKSHQHCSTNIVLDAIKYLC